MFSRNGEYTVCKAEYKWHGYIEIPLICDKKYLITFTNQNKFNIVYNKILKNNLLFHFMVLKTVCIIKK